MLSDRYNAKHTNQRAASFRMGLGGFPACTREVRGPQVTSITSDVLLLWKGLGRGLWARQGSIGNVLLLFMLTWPESAEISLPNWIAFIWLHSVFHHLLLLLQPAHNSAWLSVPVGNRRRCYRWGWRNSVWEKLPWCQPGSIRTRNTMTPTDRKPLSWQLASSLLSPSSCVHTIHRHTHMSSGVLFASLISPFALSLGLLPRISTEQEQPSNSSL